MTLPQGNKVNASFDFVVYLLSKLAGCSGLAGRGLPADQDNKLLKKCFLGLKYI